MTTQTAQLTFWVAFIYLLLKSYTEYTTDRKTDKQQKWKKKKKEKKIKTKCTPYKAKTTAR